jgi:acetoin utilization protein AcuB
MSKAIPTIQKFMTCDPVSINGRSSIAEAQDLMKEKNIRHLPVMDGAKVIGIVSDRDIHQVTSLVDVNPNKLAVEDICQTHVYTASPETPLNVVADEMAQHHYGSAVVVQNGKLVGIFTTVDACVALSKVLQERYH